MSGTQTLAGLFAELDTARTEVERLAAEVDALALPDVPPVLPAAELSGSRFTLNVSTDWHATFEHSWPMLGARFSATVNGKEYEGSCYLVNLPEPAEGHRPEYVESYGRSHGLGVNFSTWSSGTLTDSARRILSDAITSHYGPMITRPELEGWGRLAMLRNALGECRRDIGRGVSWWQYNDRRAEASAAILSAVS